MELSIRGNLKTLVLDYNVTEHSLPNKHPDKETCEKLNRISQSYIKTIAKILGESTLFNQLDFCAFLTLQRPECCVCLMPCDREEASRTNCECKDVFYHPPCLKKWLAKDDRCPTCRKKVSKSGWTILKPIPLTHSSKKKHVPPSKERLGTPLKNPSGFCYRCNGSGHKRKSNFKTARGALKHLRENHQINITGGKSGINWVCHVSSCVRPFCLAEDMIRHLIEDHHIKDIELL